ncbi:MAG: manganese efflux pump [Clostridia bacterium]|nr:manganese efflux pump [Clostridia bacterium]
MIMNFMFVVESLLLGVGLAMDAFSVSLANGMHEQKMKKGKMLGVAGTFAFFQGLMPLIGWICVHTVLQHFKAFEGFIPWIALILLSFIGIKMIVDGVRHKEGEEKAGVGIAALLVQGVATSIDALSVGFTIAEYGIWLALLSVLIIAAVTFGICLGGIVMGKTFGTKLSNKATIFGGVILVAIGIEIFITGLIG